MYEVVVSQGPFLAQETLSGDPNFGWRIGETEIEASKCVLGWVAVMEIETDGVREPKWAGGVVAEIRGRHDA